MFKWNGKHITELGLLATAQRMPLLPEPKLATEELHAADGFFDFSEFNPSHRVHYKPREWEFRLALEHIAKEESLEVSDEEIEEEIQKIANDNRMPVEKVRELVTLEGIAADIKTSKALDLIKENAVIKDKQVVSDKQPIPEVESVVGVDEDTVV